MWVGVAGLVLALFTSVCILVKAKHAGQGPFYGVGRLWIASGLAWVVWALAVRKITTHGAIVDVKTAGLGLFFP